MEEFLKGREFAKYRKLLLILTSEFVSVRLFGKEQELKELKGALEIMRQVIKLPLKIRNDEYTKKMISSDFESLKARLVEDQLNPSLQLNSEEK